LNSGGINVLKSTTRAMDAVKKAVGIVENSAMREREREGYVYL
jgi:isoaspartyl peptidase/L-asparaginase-like protein (Ntn-hydrolase superfamily)